MIRYLFIACVLISSACFGYQTLLTRDDYQYEVYEPQDQIPAKTLLNGLKMYYQAYLAPRLHVGIPLSELQIDETRFHSYEEFIEDMFYGDFLSYQTTQKARCYYFQVRYLPSDQVVSLCVVLKQDEPGFYYIDHLGTHKDFRHRGLAFTLVRQVTQFLTDCIDISLDTRIFNLPAQALYEKLGFKQLLIHPVPRKQAIYYRYVYNEQTNEPKPSREKE